MLVTLIILNFLVINYVCKSIQFQFKELTIYNSCERTNSSNIRLEVGPGTNPLSNLLLQDLLPTAGGSKHIGPPIIEPIST